MKEKRTFSKVTEETAKQPKWSDGEGITLTSIGWNKWARKKGYVSENTINNGTGEFVIKNLFNNKIIKTLVRV